jgi:SAM-dependent methyltransferase
VSAERTRGFRLQWGLERSLLTAQPILTLDPNPADDAVFDAVYPARIRLLSERFWTPVAVARRAADLFRRAGARRVLDVGAGAGKFVLVAASAAPTLAFLGIEQRADLVKIARRARSRLRIQNARFRVADVTAVPWEGFDAFYLFNPLAENLFGKEDWIDDRVELTQRRFGREVLRVEQALRRAPLGSVVVTYHGASARIPACYELAASERAGSDWLRLWTKRREADDGSLFVEVDDGIVWHQSLIAGGLAS